MKREGGLYCFHVVLGLLNRSLGGCTWSTRLELADVILDRAKVGFVPG